MIRDPVSGSRTWVTKALDSGSATCTVLRDQNKLFFRLLRIRSWDSQLLLWAQTAKSRMHLGRGAQELTTVSFFPTSGSKKAHISCLIEKIWKSFT
jgi:hypothetical protein